MEPSETASRRVHRIASHLNPPQHASCSSPLTALVCSAGSGIQAGTSARINRLLYARAIHHSTLCSQGIAEPQYYASSSAVQSGLRKDNRLLYARQCGHSRDSFTSASVFEQAAIEEPHESQLKDDSSIIEEGPLFSKPSNYKQAKDLSLDKPLFAKSVQGNCGMSSHVEHLDGSLPDKEWIPRMDIAESTTAYIVVVELPGVNAEEIRVEVNNDRLQISGIRTCTDSWGDANGREPSRFYLRKELYQGPYRLAWRIPKDSKTDLMSAEFIDGFLRILVPKVMLQKT